MASLVVLEGQALVLPRVGAAGQVGLHVHFKAKASELFSVRAVLADAFTCVAHCIIGCRNVAVSEAWTE